MRVLVLSHGDVVQALPPGECAEAMAAVLAAHARGETYMPLRSVMMAPGRGGLHGADAGVARWRDPVFSLKTVCVMPGNPARGLDAHQGIVTLFDGETGQPTAILDASAITEIRTAAVTRGRDRRACPHRRTRSWRFSAPAFRRGSHIEALTLVRPFEADPHLQPDRRTRARRSPSVTPARRPASPRSPSGRRRSAAPTSSSSATNSRRPVLAARLALAGRRTSTPSARARRATWEIEVETVAASALFPDSRESLHNEAGEFQRAIEQGAIAGGDHVRAELGEVLAGTAPGRRTTPS